MTSSAPGNGLGWRNLKTGVLFVLGVAAVASLALIINKNSGVLSSNNTVTLLVENTRGLNSGNPVQIAGMKVGSVGAMEFARIGSRTGVRVELQIRSKYFPMITSDSRALIRSVGMLGDKYVELELGSSSRALADGGIVPVAVEPGLDEAMASGIRTLGSVGEASDRVNALLAGVERGEGTLGRLVKKDDLIDDLAATVGELRGITAKMSSRDGLFYTLTQDRQMTGQVTTTLAALATTSQQLSEITGQLKDGSGTLGRLLNDTRLYDELVGTARRTDSLVAMLSQDSGPVKSFSMTGELYTKLNRSISSIDSLIADVKARPARYMHFSVFK